ncbi:molybdate ABC transporter substrate-binding protein [Phormidium sp. CLA17]|nr:molybdate ABC transporter substrate-binding protein [Leptolyngbya sp. Cla-17]
MKRIFSLALIAGMALVIALAVGRGWDGQSLAIAQNNSRLVVSAAASLTDALQEIAPLYNQTRPTVTLRYNFASSGALQQQIENGAPADIFISAADKQMDAMQQKNLIESASRRNLLTNRLVLVVPNTASGVTNLQSLKDLRVKRIAIGDPRSVPVGQYSEEALKKQGLWNSLKPKFVLANNVRQVLQFVESGNVQAGLVYATDAKTSNKVKVVQVIPASLHTPITYSIAVVKRSKNQTSARTFIQFLSSSKAKQIFQKYGFGAS